MPETPRLPGAGRLAYPNLPQVARVEFLDVDEDALRRERNKARELKQSQWWKNKRATGECHYCRRRFKARALTMDHVVPIIRGGKSTKSNVVPCCRECNKQKQNLLPSEWQEYLKRLASRDAAS